MLKLDRYLLGDFVQSFLATLIVLLVVSVGGVLVDILGNIADGRLPAKLLFSQLGLQFIAYLPLILPLALMLGLLLAIARLYRDSEMAVITAIGVGPKRLLRPLLMLVVPVVALVGACSLWLGPWAGRVAEQMIIEANRSVLMAGLEPGRFTPLPNGGVVYLSSISPDGTQLGKVFLQRQKDDRLEVVSANGGRMFFEGTRQRFLELDDGHQVEGPVAGGLDYRLATFARNDVALPDGAQTRTEDDPELMPTLQLIGDERPQAQAQLQRAQPGQLAGWAQQHLQRRVARVANRRLDGVVDHVIAASGVKLGLHRLDQRLRAADDAVGQRAYFFQFHGHQQNRHARIAQGQHGLRHQPWLVSDLGAHGVDVRARLPVWSDAHHNDATVVGERTRSTAEAGLDVALERQGCLDGEGPFLVPLLHNDVDDVVAGGRKLAYHGVLDTGDVFVGELTQQRGTCVVAGKRQHGREHVGPLLTGVGLGCKQARNRHGLPHGRGLRTPGGYRTRRCVLVFCQVSWGSTSMPILTPPGTPEAASTRRVAVVRVEDKGACSSIARRVRPRSR